MSVERGSAPGWRSWCRLWVRTPQQQAGTGVCGCTAGTLASQTPYHSPAVPQDQLCWLSAAAGSLCPGNCLLKELIWKHSRTDPSIALPSFPWLRCRLSIPLLAPSLRPVAAQWAAIWLRHGFAPWGWGFLGKPPAYHPIHGQGHWDCLHRPSPLCKAMGRGFAPCLGLCRGRVSLAQLGSRIKPE